MSSKSMFHRAGSSWRVLPRILGVLLLLSLLLSGQGTRPAHAATTLYAAPGGLTSGPCNGSWAAACTLQRAIDQAGVGDQIWVKRGTYIPSVRTTSTDSRTATFLLKNGVAIYGGFFGNETLLSSRNPATFPSILSGDINADDSANGNSYNNSYHVVRAAPCTGGSAILDGFTITAGYAYVHGKTIPGQAVTDEWSGGGMYLNGINGCLSSPALANLNFTGNTAVWGGGLASYYSDSSLTNVTFSGNVAQLDGGGLGNDSSHLYLNNVTFSGNSAGAYNGTGSGGGMNNGTTSDPELTNVTFSGNSANHGGAMAGNDPAINDSIFWGDSPTEFDGLSSAVISDSIVSGGCPSGASSCTNVTGSFSTDDPLLDPLANYGGGSNPFTPTMALRPGSPAIDAGNDATCANPGLYPGDQRGVTRPQGPHCDIGAFEFYSETISGTTNVTGTTLNYAGGPTIAGAGGTYSIDVPGGWVGRVVPSMPGYTFTPAFRDYNSVLSNLSGQNYTQNPQGITVGVYRGGVFYLRNSNTEGYADLAFQYGTSSDIPLVGDWDGDGTTTVGIYRNGVFYLRNSNSAGSADIVFPYGMPGDIPVVGDWDGNGTTTVGIYRNGTFYLRNSNTAGYADLTFAYGIPGDIPVTGKWTGGPATTIGVFRNGTFYLRNSNTSGAADAAFNYGFPSDLPVVGDWNGDGTTTIGVFRGGVFYLRNANSTGFADLAFRFGAGGDQPLAGNWDGLP